MLISSPHALHYEHARLSLQKGLHVLLRSPSLLRPTTKSLINLSDKLKLYLVVAYQRNYMAPHVYARELIRQGELGELRGVVAYVTQNWGSIRGWRLDPELSGGGMFWIRVAISSLLCCGLRDWSLWRSRLLRRMREKPWIPIWWSMCVLKAAGRVH